MTGAWYKQDNRLGGSGMQAAAAGDPGASPGRRSYKDKTMNEQLYFLQCGDKMKSWKAWQRTLFDEARRFDRQLFTKAQITALGTHLNHVGTCCRNYTGISMPDWDFCKNYGVRPQLSLGYGCTITFTPVAGYFTGK